MSQTCPCIPKAPDPLAIQLPQIPKVSIVDVPDEDVVRVHADVLVDFGARYAQAIDEAIRRRLNPAYGTRIVQHISFPGIRLVRVRGAEWSASIICRGLYARVGEQFTGFELDFDADQADRLPLGAAEVLRVMRLNPIAGELYSDQVGGVVVADPVVAELALVMTTNVQALAGVKGWMK